MMDNDNPVRRAGDSMLGEIATRLALVEQAQQLQSRAQEAQAKTIESKLDALAANVQAASAISAASHAEAQATPAGRQILGMIEGHGTRIGRLESKVEEHDEFVDSFAGSVRMMRGLVVILSVVTALLAIITFIANLPWQG